MKEGADGSETIVATAKGIVTHQVRERINGAWTGPFLIAWIFCNWRPIAVFFFSQHYVEQRIQVIDSLYCGWWTVFAAPFLLAFFYVMLCPLLTYGALRARMTCEHSVRHRRAIAEELLEQEEASLEALRNRRVKDS